jgi:hypothetical protein
MITTAGACPHADKRHAIDIFLADGAGPEYGPALVHRDNHDDAVAFCNRVMEHGAGFRGAPVEGVRVYRADNETYSCYEAFKKQPDPEESLADTEADLVGLGEGEEGLTELVLRLTLRAATLIGGVVMTAAAVDGGGPQWLGVAGGVLLGLFVSMLEWR